MGGTKVIKPKKAPRLKMTPILQPNKNIRFNPDLTIKNDARLHAKKTESYGEVSPYIYRAES